MQELEKTLDGFRAMQEAHAKAMGSPEACDLQTMIFERSRAFADLKEQLSSVLRRVRECGEGVVQLPLSCRTKLIDIWKAEQQLMDQAGLERDRIQNKLGELARLRRGVKGYARATAAATRT